MEPIGFIGVGAMGSSIASRLVGSYTLLVNDRNPAAAEDLVAQGATVASLDDIGAACRLVFLCLPGPAHVTELLLGPHGLAGRLAPGTVIVDVTSSTPAVDARVAGVLCERNIDFVDSPIAGGVARARAGTAVLMVGADPDVFTRLQEVLQHITSEVHHVGPLGTGHAMKLVNNLLNACNRFAALEAVRLGELAGLQRDVVIDVINKSSGRNYATERTYPDLLSGESYLPQGFTLELMLKDVHLANELAAGLHHETPLGRLVESFTEQAIERFGPQADQSRMMAQWYDE